jgi:pimeloyl-ACP methyl ester carboxylesterase
LFYGDHFARAAQDFEADIAATLAGFVQPASLGAVGQPSRNASVRARGGYFGKARRAPASPADTMVLNRADFEAWVAAFHVTGFSGANAWYLNDQANRAYSAEAPRFGRLVLPTLFLHAARDVNCKTIDSRLAEPMRTDCASLTEIVINGGHELMLERPTEVNEAIASWLSTK